MAASSLTSVSASAQVDASEADVDATSDAGVTDASALPDRTREGRDVPVYGSPPPPGCQCDLVASDPDRAASSLLGGLGLAATAVLRRRRNRRAT